MLPMNHNSDSLSVVLITDASEVKASTFIFNHIIHRYFGAAGEGTPVSV